MSAAKGSRARAAAVAGLALAAAACCRAYPLDGKTHIGIRRLDGDRKAQEEGKGPKLPAGALLDLADVRLTLAERNLDWDLERSEPDPKLQAALEAMVRERDPSYSLAVIDLTDPERPVWAGVRPDRALYPGSVGKVLVMIGLFDALRRAFPDPAERLRVLRETTVEATGWVLTDSHRVPIHDPETGRNRWRPIAPGDRFTLAEWVDHMVSPSSNAAGSTVWKEAMLLRRFGADYPVSREREEAFFRDTPRAQLAELAVGLIEEPLRAAGIDTTQVRQGTMFTRGGRSRVPGAESYGTPRQLARILLRVEQGRMVDAWSSLEMKRFLYFTKKRYRYVYAPELAGAAVYFKSGSLYGCAPEPGFRCGKYRGNVKNYMNSVAIVESPAREGAGARRYIVALMSNVLHKNSAWDHSRLAAAIDQAVRTRAPAPIVEAGTAAEVSEAGKGD